MSSERFSVTGMTCSACSAHVERAVSALDGVSDVAVSLLTNSMTVTYDAPASAQLICDAVKNAGYGASSMDAEAAQAVTDHAFRTILANMSSFKNERALGLALDYEMQRASDGDLAFPTIVAGGENACCLHYVKKDEPLKAGELVLLDFGIRIGTLHSDISRTIPVSGKFNPLQKMLYEIVLDSAAEYQKAVRPGVSLKEIGNIPWDFIMRELEARLVKGCKGKFKLLYDKRPHGVSHFIGEQIHEGEPGTRSLETVLRPGMLISCEPGLYGEFEATIDGKKYREKIGIRIEDDLLITKDSFRNISQNIPRTVADLEKLMA